VVTATLTLLVTADGELSVQSTGVFRTEGIRASGGAQAVHPWTLDTPPGVEGCRRQEPGGGGSVRPEPERHVT
jgi:hypothetical protein